MHHNLFHPIPQYDFPAVLQRAGEGNEQAQEDAAVHQRVQEGAGRMEAEGEGKDGGGEQENHGLRQPAERTGELAERTEKRAGGGYGSCTESGM